MKQCLHEKVTVFASEFKGNKSNPFLLSDWSNPANDNRFCFSACLHFFSLFQKNDFQIVFITMMFLLFL